MKRRVVGASIWALAMGCGPPPKPALPPPVAVTGVLMEQLSGSPIPGEVLRLSCSCHECQSGTGAPHATTASDGAFRIEAVRVGSDPSVSCEIHWLNKDIKWVNLGILDERAPKGVHDNQILLELDHTRTGAFSLYMKTAPDKRNEPVFQVSGPVVDIGRILHLDRTIAGRAFGPICESGQPKGVVPPTGLAVLSKGGKATDAWTYDELLHERLAKEWKRPFPAFVCIQASNKKVGEYDNYERDPAMEVTWRVTIINAEDGKLSRNSFTAEPPMRTRVQTSGDPRPMLLAWLAERFRASRPGPAAN